MIAFSNYFMSELVLSIHQDQETIHFYFQQQVAKFVSASNPDDSYDIGKVFLK